MLILDSHCHIQSIPGHPWDSPASRLVPLLDEAGIHCALVMGYGEASAENPELILQMDAAMREYPDRLLALARLEPKESAPETLRSLVDSDRGFIGLKLHPVGYRLPPDHPHVISLLKMAGKLGIPSLFHCGDEEFSLPLQIARAARQVPEAKIILGHMGGYFHVDDALQAALECPNIYLETSAMPFPHLVSLCVKELGADRVLFGSDGPGCLPALEVQKIYLAKLTEIEIREVLGRAYLRLLRPRDQDKILKMSKVSRSPHQAPQSNEPIPLDCRVHVKTSDRVKKSGGLWRVAGMDHSQILPSMRENRIYKACLVSGYNPCSYQKANNQIKKLTQEHKLYYWCRIDPLDPGSYSQSSEFLREKNCAGLFFHPFEENLACSATPFVNFMSQLQKNFRSNQYLMIAGGYPLVSQAEQIAHLASSLDVKILATSAGQIDICGAHLQGALSMMREHSNISVETSGIYRQDFIEDLVNEFGADRVRFGSGAPGFDIGYEAARFRWLHGNKMPAIAQDFINIDD